MVHITVIYNTYIYIGTPMHDDNNIIVRRRLSAPKHLISKYLSHYYYY